MNSHGGRLALVALAVYAIVSACASPAEPPGGPPDTAPPLLVRTSPDSGTVRSTIRDVIFSFNEVVGETPRGAQTLAGVVLVSPADGEPVVTWRRSNITVHPRKGWRPNTTYVVTLLPGVMDLRSNVRDSTNVVVFTTGDSIPRTRITGTAFDWTRGASAPRPYVEARSTADSTLAYATEGDSVGRFVLPFLPSGSYVVRALIDANHNRTRDGREAWDSVVVALRDTAGVELYMFPHDSMPRLRTIVPADSMTLHLTFDQAVSAESGYLPSIDIRAPDSTAVAVTRVSSWPSLIARRDERARQVKDSVAASDTSSVRRAAREQARRDSIERAATIADSVARDSVKRAPRPTSLRAPLVTEFAVELREPLTAGVKYSVHATAIGLIGPERRSVTVFTRPKPPATAKDSLTVKKDTLTAPTVRTPHHQ